VAADNTDVTRRLFESGAILSDDERVLVQKHLHNVRVRVCVWHVCMCLQGLCLRADAACECRARANG